MIFISNGFHKNLHAEGPLAVFLKIYFYLLNLLNLFLDICYDRPDTFSSVWEMLYVTIIVRMGNDNLFQFDGKILFLFNPVKDIWVYETTLRIETLEGALLTSFDNRIMV